MTSLADSIALPVWCLHSFGHALVEQVIADRPEPSITPGRWSEGGGATVYRATSQDSPVAKLRRLYREWFERELAELDAREWDQDAATALHRVEDHNGLIARVLRETAGVVPFVRFSIKERADGSASVAA